MQKPPVKAAFVVDRADTAETLTDFDIFAKVIFTAFFRDQFMPGNFWLASVTRPMPTSIEGSSILREMLASLCQRA